MVAGCPAAPRTASSGRCGRQFQNGAGSPRPGLATIESISREIHVFDKRVEELAKAEYPETALLRAAMVGGVQERLQRRPAAGTAVCGGGTNAALPRRLPPIQFCERRNSPGSLPLPRPRKRSTPWTSRNTDLSGSMVETPSSRPIALTADSSSVAHRPSPAMGRGEAAWGRTGGLSRRQRSSPPIRRFRRVSCRDWGLGVQQS